MAPIVRIVTSTEVAEKFKEVFGTPPPTQGFFALAEYDGKVVGFATLQPIWHVEPAWVDPQWRGRGGVFQRLLGLLIPRLPKEANMVLCFVEDVKLDKFLRHIGMEAMTSWRMFRGFRKEMSNG